MRLDQYLTTVYHLPSRSRALNYIKLGQVTVNGQVVLKSGRNVEEKDEVKLCETNILASMGGYKLKKANDVFKYDFTNKICIDIGASNGGFTQVMLNGGAAKVYAVDVGECAFTEELKNDARVIVKDKTNARFLSAIDIPEKADAITIDVSFISSKLILPTMIGFLKEGGNVFLLIKPQFETIAKNLNKNGIIKNSAICKQILTKYYNFIDNLELFTVNTVPINENTNKNTEYFVQLQIKRDLKNIE